MSSAIQKWNCPCLKQGKQFHFKIALLFCQEQISCITWFPNTVNCFWQCFRRTNRWTLPSSWDSGLGAQDQVLHTMAYQLPRILLFIVPQGPDFHGTLPLLVGTQEIGLALGCSVKWTYLRLKQKVDKKKKQRKHFNTFNHALEALGFTSLGTEGFAELHWK